MLDAILWRQATLGAIFTQIFRNFTRIFRGFGHIFKDFAQIFGKSTLLRLRLHPCLLHHCYYRNLKWSFEDLFAVLLLRSKDQEYSNR